MHCLFPKKKRVSFADPPVSREMGYEIMTDCPSPPRLEKLPPAIRSPIARKDSKRQTKLRTVLIEVDKLEKENEAAHLNSLDDGGGRQPSDSLLVGGSMDVLSGNGSVVIATPKIKLTTVITEFSINESKLAEAADIEAAITQTQDVDMFENNTVDDSCGMGGGKTSTQNEHHQQNQSSIIKLDSINLSNINKSENVQTSLDDTVDVENVSSSLDVTPNTSDGRPASLHSADQADTLPVTDSVFSMPASQETEDK